MSREKETTLTCHSCGQGRVTAYRYCRNVQLKCAECGKTFALEAYVQQMDDALEQFLENVYCDRI
ncbi:MAG: dual CXXC motif small (seleno)protein [Desulfovibrionaceae bacterium]